MALGTGRRGGAGRLRRNPYVAGQSILWLRVRSLWRMFIVLSLLWGRLFDGFQADRWDVVGGAICLAGVVVIYLGPRGG